MNAVDMHCRVAKGPESGVKKSLSQFSKQGDSTHWAARKRRYRCILPTDWTIERVEGKTAVCAAQQATVWPDEVLMIALFTNFSILFRKFIACSCVGIADFRARRRRWKAMHGLDQNSVATFSLNQRRDTVSRVLMMTFAVRGAQESSTAHMFVRRHPSQLVTLTAPRQHVRSCFWWRVSNDLENFHRVCRRDT